MKARVPLHDSIPTINKQFEEFKAFIGNDLPHFEVDIFKSNKTTGNLFASMSPPNDENDTYKLKIIQYFDLVEHNQGKSLLFHEFTHLWDFNHFFPTLYGEEKKKAGEFYSEVHASIVQLMADFDFKSVVETKRISLNDSLYFAGKEIPLDLFLLEHQAEISKMLLDTISKPTEDGIERILKHIMYYFGFLIFCENHCSGTLDKFNDISNFESIFGSKIITAYNIIRDFDNIGLNDIKELQEIRKYVKGLACHMLLK